MVSPRRRSTHRSAPPDRPRNLSAATGTAASTCMDIELAPPLLEIVPRRSLAAIQRHPAWARTLFCVLSVGAMVADIPQASTSLALRWIFLTALIPWLPIARPSRNVLVGACLFFAWAAAGLAWTTYFGFGLWHLFHLFLLFLLILAAYRLEDLDGVMLGAAAGLSL